MRWLRSLDEAGPIAFLGAGMEGELTHDESFPGDVFEGEIHFTFGVIEDAHPTDLPDQPGGIIESVYFLDSEEDKKARTDSGDDLVRYRNLCVADSLQNHFHRRRVSRSEDLFQALLPSIIDKPSAKSPRPSGDETENAGKWIEINDVNQHDMAQTRKKYDESD